MLPSRALYYLSKHAAIRSQQRAVSADALALVVAFGDWDMPAGKGYVRRALSRLGSLELSATVGCRRWSRAPAGSPQ